MTSHPTVVVDCPVCDRPLPPIVVDIDARSTGRVTDDGRVMDVTVTAQELDAAWWDAAREAHPACIPLRLRRRVVAQKATYEYRRSQ